jgi:hypothetical protein
MCTAVLPTQLQYMQNSEKKYSKGHYFLALEVHLFLDA